MWLGLPGCRAQGNDFRGRETTWRKQNPSKVGLCSKKCAGAWEKRLSKQAQLFRCL